MSADMTLVWLTISETLKKSFVTVNVRRGEKGCMSEEGGTGREVECWVPYQPC